ncbi:response regulator transcription factor [Dokdonella koreensis]|uniref:Two component LuxR family transcriptional regulator n=1 Tax=Dokdonella koreensis DS-123 TaxID=1300342 RepID=A0A167GY45_9GAMM|nr:response regulator transcription factor [Dokdonella koreensis]ANB18142.1 Two component LuxR family transcriptional regulator [Dokdonella koreensis DS-123]
MSALRIAIADDHAVVRTGYRRLLELEDGFEVVAEFGDGDSACEWLTTHAADILILDLSMPGRAGMETLQRLRARAPHLQVLVFTMHESPALAAQAMRLGARGYLTKSSPPESLVTAVRDIAAGQRSLPDALEEEIRQKARRVPLPHLTLSARELDIFLLLARGLSVEEVANQARMSFKTAANYQTSIRKKTGLGSSLDMHRYAVSHGLLPDSAGAPI